MDSLTHMTCGLKLDLTSNGRYKFLTKLLKNIAGISYQIDAQAGMAYISGRVNAKKLLERIVKAGKRGAAVCWVRTGMEYTAPCYGNGYYNVDQQRLILSYDPYGNYMGSYFFGEPNTYAPTPPSCYPSSYGHHQTHHNATTHYYHQAHHNPMIDTFLSPCQLPSPPPYKPYY